MHQVFYVHKFKMAFLYGKRCPNLDLGKPDAYEILTTQTVSKWSMSWAISGLRLFFAGRFVYLPPPESSGKLV
jgi:hypothetical protein